METGRGRTTGRKRDSTPTSIDLVGLGEGRNGGDWDMKTFITCSAHVVNKCVLSIGMELLSSLMFHGKSYLAYT